MKNIIEKLKEENIVIVFDFDGVLGSYEYKDGNHVISPDQSDWNKFVKEQHPYKDTSIIRPFKILKEFIKNKDISHIYVCSCTSSKEERDGKSEYIQREYGILPENIHFVTNKEDKLEYLFELHKEKYNYLTENQIAIIEDDVSTLDNIMKYSSFMTVHISSFLDWRIFFWHFTIMNYWKNKERNKKIEIICSILIKINGRKKEKTAEKFEKGTVITN